jgi:hypothetical protein
MGVKGNGRSQKSSRKQTYEARLNLFEGLGIRPRIAVSSFEVGSYPI